MDAMYELIIIGGGPAGVAAGVYAARKKIKTLLIAEEIGGQSSVSAEIQNWIGTESISGFELAKSLEGHLKAQKEIEVIEDDRVNALESNGDSFTVKTKNGKEFNTKTVLVASGSRHRRLGIPGEDEFYGKGVVYCATCDAPIFQGKTVAVIGGGNTGLESAIDLMQYADKIYLLTHSDSINGDVSTHDQLTESDKVEVILSAEPREIIGDTFVKALKYADKKTGDIKELKLDGVFVEIGTVPNTDFVKDILELNKYGEIVVDHKTQRSSVEGIWAVGDASDSLYKQNNISAGDAITATLNIYDYLITEK